MLCGLTRLHACTPKHAQTLEAASSLAIDGRQETCRHFFFLARLVISSRRHQSERGEGVVTTKSQLRLVLDLDFLCLLVADTGTCGPGSPECAHKWASLA